MTLANFLLIVSPQHKHKHGLGKLTATPLQWL